MGWPPAHFMPSSEVYRSGQCGDLQVARWFADPLGATYTKDISQSTCPSWVKMSELTNWGLAGGEVPCRALQAKLPMTQEGSIIAGLYVAALSRTCHLKVI